MQLNGKSISEEREGRIRHAYIFMVGEGEGAVEKALKLSGSEMDGHKLVVTALWLPLGTSRIRRNQAVAVTGYDTSLPSKLIKSALRKHFSSCVEVTNVFFVPKRTRIRRAYIEIVGEGEGEVEKALKLSGSEMDGHKLVVTALWLSLNKTTRIRRNQAVAVTGYDTSLPSKLIKSALRKHFSSCVEVTNVFFVPKKRRINTTKGPKKDRDMGGWPLQNGRLVFFGYPSLSERLANPNWREQMIEACRKKLMIQKKMAQAAEDNDAKEDGPSSSSRL